MYAGVWRNLSSGLSVFELGRRDSTISWDGVAVAFVRFDVPDIATAVIGMIWDSRRQRLNTELLISSHKSEWNRNSNDPTP